jgi:hypothetical protein
MVLWKHVTLYAFWYQLPVDSDILREIQISNFLKILQILNGYMQPYRIFESSVKPKARKMRLWENKKGESIGSDSPL